ncbi:MAG: N-acetyltransferase family protein [Sphaerochaeta sp.]
MSFNIRKAVEGEEKIALKISDAGRAIMQKRNNPQWDTGYPFEDMLIEDIEKERLYFVFEEDPSSVVGMAVFQKEKDEDYEDEKFWKYDCPYLSIHRLVSLKKGAGRFLIEEGMKIAEDLKRSVRIDTHPKNIAMQSLIKSLGFEERGSFAQPFYIDGADAIAFEIKR